MVFEISTQRRTLTLAEDRLIIIGDVSICLHL